MIKIKIIQEDITELDVDAVVNAANSYGYMGGGVAGAIKKVGGEEIELEAVSQAPILIGYAILTTAGKLRCRHVIHAPTMEQPASLTNIVNIKEAVRAALVCADENNLQRIAIPGMGTGIGGVPKDKAAEAMIKVIVNFEPKNIKEVILVDENDEVAKAWSKVLNKK